MAQGRRWWLGPGLGLALLLPVAGCGAQVEPVSFANGTPGYSVNCNWGLYGMDQCFRTAGELCQNHGYTLRDWAGQAITFDAVQQSMVTTAATPANQTILVQCNPLPVAQTAP